jgi:hypothetical protein
MLMVTVIVLSMVMVVVLFSVGVLVLGLTSFYFIFSHLLSSSPQMALVSLHLSCLSLVDFFLVYHAHLSGLQAMDMKRT